MKQSLKMSLLSLAKKLKIELRLVVDDTRPVNTLFQSTNREKGIASTIFAPFPNIIISIIRENTLNEDGTYIRPVWNPNDSIIMTKSSLPIFYNELHTIYKDMSIPDLYKYHGKKLELDEKLGESIRRVFMIGTVTVEFSAVVITTDGVNGPEYAEGIKLKFNNEASSVVLTLNETYSLLWNIDHMEIDVLTLILYNAYYVNGLTDLGDTYQTVVDIKPTEKKFEDPSLSMVDNTM